jgi:hypothetical protein
MGVLAMLVLASTSVTVAASANAATVQIGSVPAASAGGMGNCGSCAIFQLQTDAASPSYVVPAGSWVLTSWSTRALADSGGDVFITLYEPASGGQYIRRVQGTPRPLVPDQINTFEERIPVQAGWQLGFRTGLGGGSPSSYNSGDNDDATAGEPCCPANGVAFTPDTGPAFGGLLANVSAILESDEDTDGFGDETQDNCPAVANSDQTDNDADGIGNACDASPDGPPVPEPEPEPQVGDAAAPNTVITKAPKDKTKRKTATFEFTSSEAGSTFECSLDGKPFTACSSPDTFKVKKGKHHFEVRAKDAGNNVDGSPATDDWKVKKKKKKY